MNNPKQNRGRHRNNARRSNPSRQNFDSNGPGVRIRGNATQVYEKYIQLARDAQSSGDRVMAENMLQHAEHYYRILNEAQGDRSQQQQRQQQQQQQQQSADPAGETQPEIVVDVAEEATGDATEAAADAAEAPAPSNGRGRGRRSNGSNGRSGGRGRRPKNADAAETEAAGEDQSAAAPVPDAPAQQELSIGGE